MKPTCCGKPAKHYHWDYVTLSGVPAWEEGYRCKWCGRIRIPSGPMPLSEHMLAMDAIREVGIAWDLELERNYEKNKTQNQNQNQNQAKSEEETKVGDDKGSSATPVG
jgi:hypothetical protein